jgi:hypothetical protein
LRLSSAPTELSPATDKKSMQKQLHGIPLLNLSPTGNKLARQALRQLATLTKQISHLLDFI